MNRKLSALLIAAALLAPAFAPPVAQAKSAPVQTGIAHVGVVRSGSAIYILSYESGEMMEARVNGDGHVFIATGATCIGVLVGNQVVDFNGTPIAVVL